MQIQHHRFWLTAFTLISALLLGSSDSMAQTNEECERLYGTTCNHQNDVEQQQQGTSPEICRVYPNSRSCNYLEAGSDFVFMEGVKWAFGTDLGQEHAELHCSTFRAVKEAHGQHWTSATEHVFRAMVNDGVIPNTQLEYNLQMWVSQYTVNNFCPDVS